MKRAKNKGNVVGTGECGSGGTLACGSSQKGCGF